MRHHPKKIRGMLLLPHSLDDGWIRALVLIATSLLLYGWLLAIA